MSTPAAASGVDVPRPAAPAPVTRAELDRRFAEAWINTSHRVCGLRLRPYCLQQLLMLEVLRSPFVGDPEGRFIRWSDVWLFIAVCRAPWRGEVRIPSPSRIAAWAWMHRVARACGLHWLTFGILGRTLRAECERIVVFQEDYAAAPEIMSETSGRALTAPALLQRSVFMQRELGQSSEQVEMQPLGITLWEYAATLEQVVDGVELVDEQGSAFFDQVEAIQRGRIPIPPDLQAEIDQAIAEAKAAEEAAAQPPKLDPSVFGE